MFDLGLARVNRIRTAIFYVANPAERGCIERRPRIVRPFYNVERQRSADALKLADALKTAGHREDRLNPRMTAVAAPPAEARIQSVARAKAILDVLAAGNGGWVSLRAIAAGTGLAKTTAFNLATALVEVGLVEHSPAQGAYRLGVELIAYGRAVERRTDLLGFMRPYLVKLCAVTRETVNLALPCRRTSSSSTALRDPRRSASPHMRAPGPRTTPPPAGGRFSPTARRPRDARCSVFIPSYP